MYKEIAILFKKELINDDENIFKLIPQNLLLGYFDEDNEKYISVDGKIYPHFLSDNEKYVFGLNKYLCYYIDQYKELNLSFEKTLEKIFEDIKNKKYLCDFSNNKPYLVNVIDNDKTYYLLDYLCALYNSEAGYLIEGNDQFENSDINENIDYNENKREKISNINNNENNREKISNINVDTIKLYKTLKDHIIGQDENLKTIVGTIWSNYNSDNRATNMLIIGPTGVGKTQTFRIISESINVPMVVVSANQFSQVGYVGDSTTDILKNLIIKAKGDIKTAERGIVVIDELDKIVRKDNIRNDASTEAVQNELLKMIEDGSYIINGTQINTKNITFIALGAFEKINKTTKSLGFNNNIVSIDKDYSEITAQDIENYGFTSQLIGRFPIIVPYNNLKEKDFINIMNNSKSSLLLQIKELYKKQNIDLIFDDEIISIIAARARKLNHGVRGIETIVFEIMKDINFVISQNPNKYKVIITTKETLDDPKKYILR